MIKAVVIKKHDSTEEVVRTKILQTLEQFNNYRTIIEKDDWSLTVRMQVI